MFVITVYKVATKIAVVVPCVEKNSLRTMRSKMFDINKIGEKLLKLSEVKNASIGQTVFFLKEGSTGYDIGEGTLQGFSDNFAEVSDIEDATVNAVDAVYQEDMGALIPPDKVFASVEELKSFYTDIFSEKKAETKSDFCTIVPKRKAWNINQESFKENLTDKTIYPKVVAFVTNFLSNFDIPARFEIKMHGVRHASYLEGGYIDCGDISIGMDMRTISGVKIHAEMIVPVRNNQLIEPSILNINGTPRVIAQNVFSDLVKQNTFNHQLHKGPERFVSPELLKLYQDSKIVTVNPGVFGLE